LKKQSKLFFYRKLFEEKKFLFQKDEIKRFFRQKIFSDQKNDQKIRLALKMGS
jgi:hypothetical protein